MLGLSLGRMGRGVHAWAGLGRAGREFMLGLTLGRMGRGLLSLGWVGEDGRGVYLLAGVWGEGEFGVFGVGGVSLAFSFLFC